MSGAPAGARRPRRGEPEEGGARISTAGLDEVVHQKFRLAILGALSASPRIRFNDLKAMLKTTDGNLSVHARKLEEAGYIRCEKSFEDRVPLTEYALTAAGRRALGRYLEHMEALIREMRKT